MLENCEVVTFSRRFSCRFSCSVLMLECESGRGPVCFCSTVLRGGSGGRLFGSRWWVATDLGAELDRSRAGSGPISGRNSTDLGGGVGPYCTCGTCAI